MGLYRVTRKWLRLVKVLLLIFLIFIAIPLVLKYSNESVYYREQFVKWKKEDAARAEPPLPGMFIAKEENILPPKEEGEIKVPDQSTKIDWHDYAQMEADGKREGPGEQGRPVYLPKDEETKKLEDQIYRQNGYDGLVSDRIALNRSVKDIRHPECRKKLYLPDLPTVSVIFPFHNEHNSTLLRSVYSIINRSPAKLLKEVILVDDSSTKEALKQPFTDFLKSHGLSDKVKIVRTEKREGLIRARQIGASHAIGEVMIFLDAHSEANYNWLPPLLEPIAINYKTVVCPLVDIVDCETYEYRTQDEGARGSFDWEFNYKRLPITEEDRKRPSEPFDSPVMAGGYFGISTKWYWELGGYDEGLDIWGGEQYELSFKVWQCHGRLVDAPCSRVGHIYRCKYVPFPNPNVGDFISRNYRRVADVWMDEYKEHLFKRRPQLPKTDPGDLSKQKGVREKLKCKSFKWFMENVAYDQDKWYPAIEPADGANGMLKSLASEKCIDMAHKGKDEKFGLASCGGPGEQDLRLSFWHDLRSRNRGMCFDCSTSVKKAPVVIFPCHGMQGNQEFRYYEEKQQIFHPVSRQCLETDTKTDVIFMMPCDDTKIEQKWTFGFINSPVLEEWYSKKKKDL